MIRQFYYKEFSEQPGSCLRKSNVAASSNLSIILEVMQARLSCPFAWQVQQFVCVQQYTTIQK